MLAFLFLEGNAWNCSWLGVDVSRTLISENGKLLVAFFRCSEICVLRKDSDASQAGLNPREGTETPSNNFETIAIAIL